MHGDGKWWSGGAASRIAHRRRCARGRPHGGHPPAAAAPERHGGARQETAGAGAVRGLRGPHPGPVSAAGVSGPGVARRLPQVRRVRAAAGRDLHVLPAGRQGLLQAGLRQALRHQVRTVPGGLQQQRPGDARPRPRLPPGVLPLRRLRPPAAARGSVLPPGARPALPRRPRAAHRRHHRPRTPQPCAAARAPRRAGARTAARPAAAVAQSGREDHPREDGAEREAAAHAADLLRRQPETRRPDEGAAGGDDGAQPARHPCLVPEQALQGQEEVHPHEAAPAAAAQRQDEPAGPHRDAAGGRQPRPARERRAGQRGGGADLPAALEGAQRLRAAERPGAARRLPAAGLVLRVRLFGHVLRQRRDLALLPAPRHSQQHGAQPGRDVRPPGSRRRGTSACRAPCMRHPAPRRAQRAGRAPLSFNYPYLKPNRTYLADGRKEPGFSLPLPDRREKERGEPPPRLFRCAEVRRCVFRCFFSPMKADCPARRRLFFLAWNRNENSNHSEWGTEPRGRRGRLTPVPPAAPERGDGAVRRHSAAGVVSDGRRTDCLSL